MIPHTSPPLHRRTLLLGIAGMAAFAAFGAAPSAQAAPPASPNPAGPGGWASADEATQARLLDRVTWGCTAQGAQALGGPGISG